MCTLNNKANACNTACANGCNGCGWESSEIRRRGDIMRRRGMTLCRDGLRRLLVGRICASCGRSYAGTFCPNCGSRESEE